MSKLIAAMPWVGETEIALEEYGFSEDQRIRLLADKRRAQAAKALEARGIGLAFQEPEESDDLG